jgi:hypothetical protein
MVHALSTLVSALENLPAPLLLAVTPPVGGLLFLFVATVAELVDSFFRHMPASPVNARRKATPPRGGPRFSVRKALHALCLISAAVFMLDASAEIVGEVLERCGLSVSWDLLHELPAQFAAGDSATVVALMALLAGAALVVATEQLLSDKSKVIVVAMFLHTAAEGAGLGVLTKHAFDAAVPAMAMHNLFEGAVVAASKDPAAIVARDAGHHQAPMKRLRRTAAILLRPCVSHAPQWLAVVALRQFGGKALVTEAMQVALMAFAVGSMLATIALELVPEAVSELGFALTAAAAATVWYACF